jgi:hypothetical protein
MSKINTYNYEAFLLDYWEGNLSAGDVAELLLFINNHPELNIELDTLSIDEQLSIADVPADFKNNLKKTNVDVQERFNYLCLAFYDKTISTSEKISLDELMKEFPILEKEFKYFENTYLLSDLNIVYPIKSTLQKLFIPANSFEFKAIQYLEGELNENEKIRYEKEIKENENLKLEFNKYKITKLVDVDIIFKEKNKLYKSTNKKTIIPIWMRFAAAAAIIISFGIYLSNSNSLDSIGIASVQTDTIKLVRPAKGNLEKVNGINKIQPIKSISNNNKINNSVLENSKTHEQLVTLRNTNKIEIEEPFILETEYMALVPLPTLELNETSQLEINSDKISTSNLLFKKLKKILKKENIDIDTPIASIKENGIAESSIQGLELITNGAISIQRENTEKGKRYTGFSIGSLSYSRSNSK